MRLLLMTVCFGLIPNMTNSLDEEGQEDIRLVSLSGQTIPCPRDDVYDVSDLLPYIPGATNCKIRVLDRLNELTHDHYLHNHCLDGPLTYVLCPPEPLIKFGDQILHFSNVYGCIVYDGVHMRPTAETVEEKIQECIENIPSMDICIEVLHLEIAMIDNAPGTIDGFRMSPVYWHMNYFDRNFVKTSNLPIVDLLVVINQFTDQLLLNPDELLSNFNCLHIDLFNNLIMYPMKVGSTSEVLINMAKNKNAQPNELEKSTFWTIYRLLKLINSFMHDPDINVLFSGITNMYGIPDVIDYPNVSDMVMAKYKTIWPKLNKCIHLLVAPQMRVVYDVIRGKSIGESNRVDCQLSEVAGVTRSFKSIFARYLMEYNNI